MTDVSDSNTPYDWALEKFDSIGVDAEKQLQVLNRISLSLQCWQGDDVVGFEESGESLGGGLQVTGHYPGRARNIDELMSDLEKVLSLIPGHHRVNLHASYGDFKGKKVERNEICTDHFDVWADWAKFNGVALDFNPTFFAHQKALDGFTLSHPDAGIRDFWIEHGIAARQIGAFLGRQVGLPSITNFWIPDGYKDTPVDRYGPRERLIQSLDKIFYDEIDELHNLDAVESKLFGLGSESFTTGSHEFYIGYAISRKKLLCLDSGHFHPTECISDKLSALMPFLPGLLLHISRGVRWDSDHVVTLNDATNNITKEIVHPQILEKTHIGLDFFDASINRIAAWVIGSRNVLKSLMISLLQPRDTLLKVENEMDYSSRLALQEDIKLLPYGILWDRYCEANSVPVDLDWMNEVKKYESNELSQRDMTSNT